jgi:hypothetical protein
MVLNTLVLELCLPNALTKFVCEYNFKELREVFKTKSLPSFEALVLNRVGDWYLVDFFLSPVYVLSRVYDCDLKMALMKPVLFGLG